MTTEDDFQRDLDDDPSDHHTRTVLADWLEERGDERAEGYRALGLNRIYPHLWYYKGAKPYEQVTQFWLFHNGCGHHGNTSSLCAGEVLNRPGPIGPAHVLPQAWIDAVVSRYCRAKWAASLLTDYTCGWPEGSVMGRRGLEDRVTSVFGALPDAMRVAFLRAEYFVVP
jgi:uncharacterized protein (TIGR02996 family)